MDIEVCVMLDSTPGEIDRDIDVTLNTNAATAGQLKHYYYNCIIYYAPSNKATPYRDKHILTSTNYYAVAKLQLCEALILHNYRACATSRCNNI